MKKTSFEKHGRLTTLAMLIALAASVNLAKADWKPGDPYKWVQMPDLEAGMDVLATEPKILADDFQCTFTGPITDIHIWGSWLNDIVDDTVTFKLSIHSDVPATPTSHSYPGPELWSGVFQPGQYIPNLWPTPAGYTERFYDPNQGLVIGGDTQVWQYNFFIPEADAFVQQGTSANPVVYWLDVQAQTLTPSALFGWKTTYQPWNDDATWSDVPFGAEPAIWNELIDQTTGTSLDMAFVITTIPEPGTAMLLGLGAAVLLIARRRRV